MSNFYLKFKSLSILLFIFISAGLKAQVSTYTFTSASSTYSPITGGTVLATATGTTGAASLDDVVYTLPANTIPFNFNFDGTNYTSCYVSTNGFIAFGTTAPAISGSSAGYAPLSAITAYSGAISAFGRNLNAFFFSGNAAQTGEIRYQTLGAAPNRVFVIQYLNFKTFNTSAATFGPVLNMQIRLLETTNTVECVYNCSGNIASATGQVGLRGPNSTFPTNVNNRSVAASVNNWATSTAGTANTSTCEISSTLLPASGLVYRYTPVQCPPAQNLLATNITQTTASLTWTTTVTGSTFKVEYGPAGFTPGSGTVINNATSPASISGLTQNTNYTFFVQQNCGSNGTSINASANFTSGTAGEDCATALSLNVASSLATCSYTTASSGQSANGPNASCSDVTGNIPNDDRWFKFTAPAGGKKLVVTTTAGTVNDWTMEVWDACNGSAISCSDDVNGFMPEITLCQNEYTAGQVYFVRLWTYSNTVSGTANICVYEDAACSLPPSNDECADAIRVPVNLPLACPTALQTFTTIDATVNSTTATCDASDKRDVYFVFNTGNYPGINIQINPVTATSLKAQLLFECGNLQINCWNPANGIYNFTGFNPVADYILRVWSDSATGGTFNLCLSATCASPTATLSGSGTVCPGTPASLNVALTGVAPYTFTYSNGSTNTVVTTSSSNYTLNVSPNSTTTYSLVSMSDAACSGTVSGTSTVNVVNPQTVVLNQFNPICSNVGPVILTGANPSGGVYSGVNVSNGAFNPIGGTQTITYTVTYAPGCTRSASQSYPVLTATPSTFAALPAVCTTDAPFTLTGGSPTPGVYSGNGVTNNVFSPSAVGVGNWTITYTFTNANGCPASSISIQSVTNCTSCPNPPTANAGIDRSSCGGAAVSITGSIGGGATSLTWTNGTGTYSPNATSSTITYTPSAAEITAGFARLILVTNDPDGTGPCVAARDTMLVNITQVQNVTLSSFTPVCISASNQTLTGGSPAGGVYSGTNVTNNVFNPSGGTQTITYTVTFAAGCTRSASQVFTVNPLPTVTMGAVGTYCTTDAAVTLTQGSASGGTYSGTGVSNGQFNPATAGVGTFNITYTFTNANGCTNTATNTVTVNSCACANPPTANAGSNVSSCGGAAVSITGSIGGGATSLTWTNGTGTYSPNATSSTITYTPSAAEITAGFARLILVTNDPDGTGPCVAARDTMLVNITQVQNVTLSSFTPVCISASNQTLTGGSPAGGVYSGTNVTNNVFNPSGGTQTITYTVTFAAGCTRSASQVFTVNPLPTVTMGAVGTYCATAAAVTLTQGSPSGGTYSGTGVSNGQFNPATAGIGTFPITYTFTNANGCTNTATNTVTVGSGSTPTITANGPTSFCSGGSVVLTSSSATGNTWSTGATTQSITVTTSGSYSVTVGSGTCTGTSSATIVSVSNPTAAPATPGAITGTTTFVCGQTLTYSIAAVAGATSYTWSTNVAGALINGSAIATTSATSVSITWPSTMPATGDSIRVVASNCFGNSAVRVLVASAAKPATPGTVTGVNQTTTGGSAIAYIAGQTVVYSFAAPVVGAVSYTWSTNVAGATLNGSTSGSVTVAGTSTGAQSVTVTWPSVVPATGDTLRVVANGNCGSSSPRVLVLTCAKPATPGTISGTAALVCGQTITYSIAAPIAGATSYTWRTNVAGAKINGSTATSVTVNATSSGAQSATIEWPSVMPATGNSLFLRANGNCGSSSEKALAVTTSKPATPGVISGQASGVCNSTRTYSIPAAIAGAVSYTWSTNCPGATINSSGTSATTTALSVNVTWPTDTNSTRKDSLRVIANGNCGSSAARVLVVTRIPGTPASITGSAAPCLNANQLYVASPVVGSTGYFWTYATAGTSYISGQGDDSLTVRFTTAGTKTITTRATNACSRFTNNVPNGTARTLAVTATSCVRLADVNNNAEILVYPNPAIDLATLTFDMQTEINCTVSIIDMLGRVVFAREIAASAGQNMIDLNVQDLKSGIYSVTLTANGNRSAARLIVD